VTILNRAGRSPLAAAAIRRLLNGAGRRVGAPAGEVTVVLVGDPEMRRLNRRFRGKDRPTDVLSFPDGTQPAKGGSVRVGDIVISIPAARRNASRLGHPLRTEIRHLLIHGMLHLLGYDHEVDGGEMESVERVLREGAAPR